MYVIISLDDPENVLGVEGQVIMFTTADEALDFCGFIDAAEDSFGVVEAPEGLTGFVVV